MYSCHLENKTTSQILHENQLYGISSNFYRNQTVFLTSFRRFSRDTQTRAVISCSLAFCEGLFLSLLPHHIGERAVWKCNEDAIKQTILVPYFSYLCLQINYTCVQGNFLICKNWNRFTAVNFFFPPFSSWYFFVKHLCKILLLRIVFLLNAVFIFLQ